MWRILTGSLSHSRYSINAYGRGIYWGKGRGEGNSREPRGLSKANKRRACDEWAWHCAVLLKAGGPLTGLFKDVPGLITQVLCRRKPVPEGKPCAHWFQGIQGNNKWFWTDETIQSRDSRISGSIATSFPPESSLTLLWDQIHTNQQEISELEGPNFVFSNNRILFWN